MENAIIKAKILSQALPYIQHYNGKVVVIKYGGNAMINEELKMNVISDVVLLSTIGIKVILVHGGGPDISKTLNAMGLKSKFVDGLRVTDQDTVDVVQMVLAGKTNKDLTKLIIQHGGKAVGVSGLDNMLIEATQNENAALGYVGDVRYVKDELLNDLLDKGYIPVVASVGMDREGHSYNINADTVACAIASKMQAENMILVSDIPGLLKDVKDESSLIPIVHLDDYDELVEQGVISGGMIPKIQCCMAAIEHGLEKACIIDGRISHSILIEMLTNEGIGTMFRK